MIHSSSFILFPLIFRTNTIERVLLTGRGNDIHIAIRAIDPLTSCILLDMIYNSIDHPTNLYHNGAYLAIAHKKNVILYNTLLHTMVTCTSVYPSIIIPINRNILSVKSIFILSNQL